MVCLNNNLPVPVLAESGSCRTKAREGTESSESLTSDSRGGGQKIPTKRNKHIHTDWRFGGAGIHKRAEIKRSSEQKNLSGGVESRHAKDEALQGVSSSHTLASGSSAPPAQKIKQDAAYYRSYRARNKERIQKQEETRRRRDRNKKWVVQTVTGLPDIGIKVLSEFQVDVAMRAFWGKRGMAVPSATMGGILPSVSDFNEEVSILQMRTCI